MNLDAYDFGSSLLSGHVQPVTGWTSPSLIYDNMRLINASAVATDIDITTHSKSESLKAAWASWYASWKTFFAKHQGLYQRLGNAFQTDGLASQVEQWRKSLGNLQATYAAEPGVPGSTNPAPGSFEKPSEEKEGLSIPWWGWALGGALLVGAGFMVYRQVKELRAKKESLEKNVLPLLLNAQLGPQLGQAVGQAAIARDPQMMFISRPGVTYGP
jgi:hypothetical protein